MHGLVALEFLCHELELGLEVLLLHLPLGCMVAGGVLEF